jgi:hypothetical protein
MEIGLKVKPIVHEKIIKEALSRIGIANRTDRALYPSCYLTIINNQYIIAHFKELFPILNSNGEAIVTDQDISRRNTIINLLKNWNLIEIQDPCFETDDKFVFVLKREFKDEWTIFHKINLNTLNRLENEGIEI